MLGVTIGWIQKHIFGFNQTLVNVTADRSANVTYTNDTKKPIFVSVTLTCTTGGHAYAQLLINGIRQDIIYSRQNYDFYGVLQAIVPVGATYKVNIVSRATVDKWGES